ncbi:MAG: hypothetical protein KDB53_21985 [Planctomycetes bacterium]|nr:hypothetical protein [Planctomycetota bacterium]
MSTERFATPVLRLALGCAVLAWTTSCGSTPQEVAQVKRDETEEALVRKALEKDWIDFESQFEPERRRELIASAIAMSRSSAALYYDRVLEAQEAQQRATQEDAKAPRRAPAGEVPVSSAKEDPDETFSFEFRDAPLSEVVYFVAGELGMNVFVPGDMTERVTVSFPSVDARKGLETILDRYGYRMHEQGGIQVFEKKPAAPLITRTFPLRTGVQINLETQVTPLIGPRGRAFTDPKNRALVVIAEEDDLDGLAHYLEILDRRPRQVLIEALVVEVGRANTLRHGVSFRKNDLQMGSTDIDANWNFLPVPPAGAAANPFTLGIMNTKNMIDFMLSADDSINRLNVLHSPFVSTVSGEKATLRVIESIPFIRATTSIGADQANSSGTITSTQEIEFEEAGVTLEVTPNIGDDDIIEMLVKPKIEELVDFLVGVPVIDTREAETRIQVRNQETLVIGGLLRNSYGLIESGIPLLKDIPLLGELFKSVEKRDEKIELLIFVTPRIIGYGFEPYDGFQAQEHYLGPDRDYNNVHELLNREDRDRMRHR